MKLGLLDLLSSLFLTASLKRNFQDAIPLVNILSMLVLHINVDMSVISLLRNFFNHVVKLGAILLLPNQSEQVLDMATYISSYMREAFNFLSALTVKLISTKEIACLRTVAFDGQLQKMIRTLLNVSEPGKIAADTLLSVVMFQDMIVNVVNGVSISSLTGGIELQTEQWRSLLAPAMNKLKLYDLLLLVEKAENRKTIILSLHLMKSYMRHDLVDQSQCIDACRKTLLHFQDLILDSNEDVRFAATVGIFELFAMVAASSSTRHFQLLVLQPWHLFLTETILLELDLHGLVPGSHLLYLCMMLEFSFFIRNKPLLELFGAIQVQRLLSLWTEEDLPNKQKLALTLLLKQLHECKSPHVTQAQGVSIQSMLSSLVVSPNGKPDPSNKPELPPVYIQNIEGVFVLPTVLSARWPCRATFGDKKDSLMPNASLVHHFQRVSSALSMYAASVTDQNFACGQN